MNLKKWLLVDVLVGFLAVSLWAAATRGVGMIADLWTPTGLMVVADLYIALTMASVWIWHDARTRGMNPLPYVAATLLVGSAGPLLYLIRREWIAEARLRVRSAAAA